MNTTLTQRLRRLWPFLLPAAALLVLAWPTLRELAKLYMTDENYSHGFWIPIIALFMAYQRRQAPTPVSRTVTWAGLGLVLLGTAVTVFGRWYCISLRLWYHFHLTISGVGLVLCLAGLCWIASDRLRLDRPMVPALYLLFALPPPGHLIESLTVPLQGFSAALVTPMLRWTGLQVLREGNILHLPNAAVGIEEACSGVRSTWVVLTIAVALLILLRLSIRKSAALLISVPFWAMAGNVLRIFVTTLFVAHGHAELAKGPPHETLGLATTALAGIGLFLTAWVLGRKQSPIRNATSRQTQNSHIETISETAAHADSPPPAASRVDLSSSPLLAICAAFLILLGSASAWYIEQHYFRAYAGYYQTESNRVQARLELRNFPDHVGDFTQIGVSELKGYELDILGPTDSVQLLYRSSEGQQIALVLLYWQPTLVQPNVPLPFKAPHNPEICYPGSGWDRASDWDRIATFDWLPGETVRSMLLRKDGTSQVLVYWRTESMNLASITKRLKAMIRSWNNPLVSSMRTQYSVAIGVTGFDTPESGRAVALQFAREIAPLLPEYGIGRRAEREEESPAPNKSGSR